MWFAPLARARRDGRWSGDGGGSSGDASGGERRTPPSPGTEAAAAAAAKVACGRAPPRGVAPGASAGMRLRLCNWRELLAPQVHLPNLTPS